MLQTRISDTITHVTLNTINGVIPYKYIERGFAYYDCFKLVVFNLQKHEEINN